MLWQTNQVQVGPDAILTDKGNSGRVAETECSEASGVSPRGEDLDVMLVTNKTNFHGATSGVLCIFCGLPSAALLFLAAARPLAHALARFWRCSGVMARAVARPPARPMREKYWERDSG